MIILALAAMALAAPDKATPPTGAPPPAAAAPAPSPETRALARSVATGDDFLALVRFISIAQIAGVEAKIGPLTEAEKAKAGQIGEATLVEGENRVIDRLGDAYARHFSADELKAISAFLATPAGRAWSNRLPQILPGFGEAMKGFDFKRRMMAETCAQIHKGCPPPPGK
jgi:hypothetical protein